MNIKAPWVKFFNCFDFHSLKKVKLGFRSPLELEQPRTRTSLIVENDGTRVRHCTCVAAWICSVTCRIFTVAKAMLNLGCRETCNKFYVHYTFDVSLNCFEGNKIVIFILCNLTTHPMNWLCSHVPCRFVTRL
jgi:hypothetical protein